MTHTPPPMPPLETCQPTVELLAEIGKFKTRLKRLTAIYLSLATHVAGDPKMLATVKPIQSLLSLKRQYTLAHLHQLESRAGAPTPRGQS